MRTHPAPWLTPVGTLLALLAVRAPLASCGDCDHNSCSISPSVLVRVADAAASGPVAGAFVEVRTSGVLLGTVGCQARSDVSECLVGGGAGTFDLRIGALGYQTVERTVVVPSVSAGCCHDVVTQTLEVNLASAQPCAAPLQVDLFVEMPADAGASVSFSSSLRGGQATVSGVVTNQPDRQTAQMDVLFDYATPDPIALDELIECIEGAIEGMAPVLINTNLINLNPNRGVTLGYRATLYRPRDASYRFRFRVGGNYE